MVKTKRGRKRLYDWETWFKRGQITLWRGLNYNCSQSALIQQARNEASERGYRIKVHESPESVTLEVVHVLRN